MKANKRLLILAALLSLVFTAKVRAQLPNAWQMDDHTNTAGSFLSYTNLLNAGLRTAATNAGFDFSVTARFVTDYGGTPTMYMAYGLGTNRFLIWWGLNGNGDLTAQMDTGGTTFILTTNGAGSALYHTNEIIYNPTNGTASYLFDGQVISNNWPPSAYPANAGQIAWGAGSSIGEGEMNFHTIRFVVTNGIVAGYNAGTEPTNAPAPASQGWTLDPASPPSNTSTNAISPDRGAGVITTLADSGYGSLRQAITDARPGDTITFFTNGVITLTSSQLIITTNLTIAGPGPASLAISGNNIRRPFYVQGGVVSISGLTIENGHGPNATTDSGAGGHGGGIYNSGSLTLSNCVIVNNVAGDGGDGSVGADGTIGSPNGATGGAGGLGGSGGGIFNGGVLTLTTCTVNNNTAGGGGTGGTGGEGSIGVGYPIPYGSGGNGGGGGKGGSAGGIYNSGALVLNDCITYGNSAGKGGKGGDGGGTNIDDIQGVGGGGGSGGNGGDGGLVCNVGSGGGLVMTDCTVNSNRTGGGGDGGALGPGLVQTGPNGGLNGSGGAIFNNSTSAMINDSILSGNSAFGGGGIENSNTLLAITNSTFSGNSSDGGGAIKNENSTLTISDSTLSGNYVIHYDYGDAGAILNEPGSELFLNNSTLSGNSGPYTGGIENNDAALIVNNSTVSGNSSGINGYGTLALTNTIVAGNTFGDIAGSFSGANNLTNGNPLLAPLGNYGGPTQTMPPLAGSPAIDAGDDSAASPLVIDQRGYPRLSGAHVDIGAVEAQFAPANNPPLLTGSTFSTIGGVDSFQFLFTNVPDADFTVLASTNLALPLADWVEIGYAVQNPPGQYQFTDPDATNYPQRFYQVVSP